MTTRVDSSCASPDMGDMSIVVCTRNRAERLRSVLDCLVRAAPHAIGPWTALVVNNGSTDHTERVLEEFESRIDLRHVVEAQPGKWAALNRALIEVRSDHVVFTDDDVFLPNDWIAAWQRGFLSAPWAGWFGGPIEIVWEGTRPSWARPEDALHPLFQTLGAYHRGAHSRPYAVGEGLPYGANMGVRLSMCQGVGGYRSDLGPEDGRARVTGGDTEWMDRVRRSGVKGWYVHDALVRHRVHESEFRYRALWRRGVGQGRARVRIDPATPSIGTVDFLRRLANVGIRWCLRQPLESRWSAFAAGVAHGIRLERRVR